jgi:prepilin-type N-terminal cleavage/methylation domain-containing protein
MTLLLSPRRPGSGSQGFTLLEVMLAIAMVSFIMMAMYATLFTTMEARDQIEKESLKIKVGPAILTMIERDIMGVWCMNIHQNEVFRGEDYTVNGEPADTIHMITTTDSNVVEYSNDEPIRADITEVSYRLRPNPQNEDWMELWRRESFHVDDRFDEGGDYECIYRRIKQLQVVYYKDLFEGAEDLDEWDSKTRNSLPVAMEIFLSLEIDPRLAGYSLDEMDRPSLDYNRVIFFPQGSALTMAVRPVIPTFVDPEAQNPPGGLPGGGEGQPDGGGKEGDPRDAGFNGDGKGDGGLFDGPGPDFNPGDPLPDMPDLPPDGLPDPPDDLTLEELLKLLGGGGGGGGGWGG